MKAPVDGAKLRYLVIDRKLITDLEGMIMKYDARADRKSVV